MTTASYVIRGFYPRLSRARARRRLTPGRLSVDFWRRRGDLRHGATVGADHVDSVQTIRPGPGEHHLPTIGRPGRRVVGAAVCQRGNVGAIRLGQIDLLASATVAYECDAPPIGRKPG